MTITRVFIILLNFFFQVDSIECCERRLKIRLNLKACLKIVGIFYGNYYHIVANTKSVQERKLRIAKCIKLYYNSICVSFHYHLYNMYYKGYVVKFFIFCFIQTARRSGVCRRKVYIDSPKIGLIIIIKNKYVFFGRA